LATLLEKDTADVAAADGVSDAVAEGFAPSALGAVESFAAFDEHPAATRLRASRPASAAV